jgi:hypothetical protein
VAKSSFRLSDIMATTDFLLKQSTTNNRHDKKSNAIFNWQDGTFYKKNTLNTQYFF